MNYTTWQERWHSTDWKYGKANAFLLTWLKHGGDVEAMKAETGMTNEDFSAAGTEAFHGSPLAFGFQHVFGGAKVPG